jgi:hypothetical protein
MSLEIMALLPPRYPTIAAPHGGARFKGTVCSWIKGWRADGAFHGEHVHASVS